MISIGGCVGAGRLYRIVVLPFCTPVKPGIIRELAVDIKKRQWKFLRHYGTRIAWAYSYCERIKGMPLVFQPGGKHISRHILLVAGIGAGLTLSGAYFTGRWMWSLRPTVLSTPPKK